MEEYLTVPEAIALANKIPENEYQRLYYAWAKAIVETWSASCSTDRYIDLKPWNDAETKARKAFQAYINGEVA